MNKKIRFILTVVLCFSLLCAFLITPSSLAANNTDNTTVPLLKNISNYHHPISTKSQLAQRYFDQGLIFTYGFNHAEAARSFAQAATLDTNCAMCYWGIALVKGPNINANMEDSDVLEAGEALQKAIELSQNATPQEKDYIQAVAKRYPPQAVADRKSFDIAYAKAMGELYKRYPDDLDAATLFAEAQMDIMPWDYWTKEGEAKPETKQILATLESVLKRNPNHPGANHMYIHAVEASPNPQLAIASADRLGNLVPEAGHLVHMPSHIYIRVGRYHDAVVANQRAIVADQHYITQCHAQGFYNLAYMPHNHHFLLAAATMDGESKLAIKAARHTVAMVDQKLMHLPEYATLQHYYSMLLYTLTKFGKWDEILQEKAPAVDLIYSTGVWHYARGIAFTGKGELKKAAQELEQLQLIANDPSLEKVVIWGINSSVSLMEIASHVLAGEIAAKQEDYQKAISQLSQAVEVEDNLRYDEPSTWYSSVRQSLGAVLLAANRPQDAETAYREDLKRNPENGWSLFGLAQSLKTQGKIKEAQQVEVAFQKAWKYADVKLAASEF